MDHHVQPGGYGEFKMPTQEISLPFSVCFLIPPLRSRMKIIQARLADRAYPWIGNMVAKTLHGIVRCVVHIARMYPYRSQHPRIIRKL